MELVFRKWEKPCLQQILRDVKEQEQTQEVRISDGMADIGRVVGAWGQVILRSKEWRSDRITITGGVMAWVLYVPENGGPVQRVETWLPWTLKWDIPLTEREGTILVKPLLRSVDARSTSARKLMVRSLVSILVEAQVMQSVEMCSPEQYPQDIQLLKNTYPVLLCQEGGEKAFSLEEQPELPGSEPKIEKLLYYCLQPELIDKKVMGSRLVFRGMVILHMVYEDGQGNIHSRDVEIPFSQFCELDRDYEQQAVAAVYPAITALELEQDPEGKLQIKAGLVGQYVIYDQSLLELAEDAYSTQRSVELIYQDVQLPGVLCMERKTVYAEKDAPFEGEKMIDIQFYPYQSTVDKTPEGATLNMGGKYHLLYADGDGNLRTQNVHWEDALEIPVGASADLYADVQANGKPQADRNAELMQLRAGIAVNTLCTMGQGIHMLTGLVLGEQEAQTERPGIILCRKGPERLWDVAKACGSTVDAICKANGLTEEPPEGKLLLIPM